MTDNILVREDRATAQVGDEGYLFVSYDAATNRNGVEVDCWTWKIFDCYMTEVDASSDHDQIYSPADMVKTPLETLQSLVSFLSACAESADEESDNYTLFSTPAREWAEMASDDLQMLSLEIEEDLGR